MTRIQYEDILWEAKTSLQRLNDIVDTLCEDEDLPDRDFNELYDITANIRELVFGGRR